MTELRDLLSTGLIRAPLEIKPLSNAFLINSNVTSDGRIKVEGRDYDNLQSAMTAALQHYPNQTLVPLFNSTAWQFWAWFNPNRDAWTPLEHLRGEYESRALRNSVRTSTSDPLQFDEINIGKGVLGLTFCPGKVTQGIYGGYWRRDLPLDCQRIHQWHASHIITLIEEGEFSELGVPDLAEALNSLEAQWIHLPIRDMDIPNSQFEARWRQLSPAIHSSLKAGARIVIHCRGGLGRTGLMAALILIESGMPAVKAIRTVRKVRQRTIETFAQEEYLLHQSY